MNLRSLTFIISTISDVSELIPCFFFFRYVFGNPTFRILGYYLVLSALIKNYTMVTAVMHIHNMPAFHLLALLEVVLLYSFYNRIIFNTAPSRVVLFLLVVLSVLDSFFIEGLYQFNSIGWSLGVFFLLCLGLRYLFMLYKDLETIQLERDPLFIITTGFLIYFSGSLFTYIFAWQILSRESKEFFHNAWIIQCFSNIIKNIFISYGLWLARFR